MSMSRPSRPRRVGRRAASAVLARTCLAGLGFLGLTGCQETLAEVTVAWVDAADAADGSRKLQVYDRGDRFSVKIVPIVPGSDPVQLLAAQVDRRGRGIAVADPRSTTYVSARNSRESRLSSLAAGGRNLANDFSISRNGDALTRGFESDATGQLAFMPLTSPAIGEVTVLVPPAAVAGGVMQASFASNAPVGFWVERSGSPARGWGRLSAFLYPSELSGEMPVVDEVTSLSSGRLFVAIDSVVRTDRHAPQWWCPGGVCISSDGRSATAMAEDRCSVSWWQWEKGLETPDEELEPQVVRFVDGCPPDRRPSIFAQLSHDVVVLDDAERIYLGDLTTGTLVAGPKIWESNPVLRVADDGRAMVVISVDSRVTRIDADGVRLVSPESFPCFGPPTDARVSPSGLWMIRSCNGDGTFVPSTQGAVVRVSPLGVEVFPGVPMLPLGIDDLGNALLNSQSEDGEPRGLFVLSGDGSLSRIDPLEPEPAFISDGRQNQTFFATSPVRP